MTLGVVLVLILFGLILIIVELFLIPGSTVVGFSGFGMACVGVYGSFEVFGMLGGIITLLLTGGVSLLGLYIAIQDQTMLVVNQEGVTISALRPGGTVSFDNKYFEVFSSSVFVDVGQKVKITSLKSNKIFVDRFEDQ